MGSDSGRGEDFGYGCPPLTGGGHRKEGPPEAADLLQPGRLHSRQARLVAEPTRPFGDVIVATLQAHAARAFGHNRRCLSWVISPRQQSGVALLWSRVPQVLVGVGLPRPRRSCWWLGSSGGLWCRPRYCGLGLHSPRQVLVDSNLNTSHARVSDPVQQVLEAGSASLSELGARGIPAPRGLVCTSCARPCNRAPPTLPP